MALLSGILVVDKPVGPTSMDVVRLVKRLTKQRRVGHGGTLDPFASGVLPICFGQATRTMEFLINGVKLYRAQIRLGVSTDTYDNQGKVTSRGAISTITLESIEQKLNAFRGTIDQVPPMFSALKQNGRRLYDIARAGQVVTRAPRRVHVFRLGILGWDSPYLDVEIECGRGFYVRSFANDFGEAIGCGAHLSKLVRERAGPFSLSKALSLEQAETVFASVEWPFQLYPVDTVFLHLRAAIIGKEMEKRIRQGQSVALRTARFAPVQQEGCRAYNVDGRFVALLRFQQSPNIWQPEMVFGGVQ
jgi:tRNA pseudouridine55 synthase